MFQQATLTVDAQINKDTLLDSPEDLEVLVKPQEMFDDLVRRFPEFADFARDLNRPLRVATMCSGTEAPLLAMEMMSQGMTVIFTS